MTVAMTCIVVALFSHQLTQFRLLYDVHHHRAYAVRLQHTNIQPFSDSPLRREHDRRGCGRDRASGHGDDDRL